MGTRVSLDLMPPALVLTRRDMPLHARFMICTGFMLIDPVVIRLMIWIHDNPSWNYQWFLFGLTDLVILTLIWLEREARSGRWVFPGLLVVFVASQLPALLQLTNAPAWQAFAKLFAALQRLKSRVGCETVRDSFSPDDISAPT